MPKTVSASEAKNRFGAVIGWVVDHGDEIIVESHGEAKVVVMAYAEYQKVRDVKVEMRRREALARLRALRDAVRSRNTDLTEEEADSIANRFAHDLADDLGKKGKMRFEK